MYDFSLLEYCNILHIKICNKRYQPKTDVLSAEIWQRKCHVIICNQRWHLKNCCLIFKKMTTHTTHQNLLSKITPQKLLSYLLKDDTTYITSSSTIKDDTPKIAVLSAERWQCIYHVIICNQRWHPQNCCLICRKITAHMSRLHL